MNFFGSSWPSMLDIVCCCFALLACNVTPRWRAPALQPLEKRAHVVIPDAIVPVRQDGARGEAPVLVKEDVARQVVLHARDAGVEALGCHGARKLAKVPSGRTDRCSELAKGVVRKLGARARFLPDDDHVIVLEARAQRLVGD